MISTYILKNYFTISLDLVHAVVAHEVVAVQVADLVHVHDVHVQNPAHVQNRKQKNLSQH